MVQPRCSFIHRSLSLALLCSVGIVTAQTALGGNLPGKKVPAPDRSSCSAPYSKTGSVSYRSEADPSYVVFSYPSGKYLQVKHAKARVSAGTLSSAHIFTNAYREEAWYPMRVSNNTAQYAAQIDAPVYFGPSGHVMIFASPGVGDIATLTATLEGCLVDSLPRGYQRKPAPADMLQRLRAKGLR